MSAPTALDGGALLDGVAYRVPRQALTREPFALRTDGSERRADHALAILTREHDDLCTQAADRSEIAAGLESAGVSDRLARQSFGVASVFELADVIYELVPRRPTDGHAPSDPWRRPIARHLMRGLLYALPGLLYVVALRTLHTGSDVVMLIVATGLASATGQGLSLLGHVLIGRADLRAAGNLFRIALLAAAAMLGLLVTAGLLVPGLSPRTGTLAGAQIVYLLAATVLIVVEAEFILLTLLMPGVVVSAGVLTGLLHLREDVVLGVLGASLLATVLAAGSRFARRDVRSGRRLRDVVGRDELRICRTYILYGAANAGLLSFSVVDALIHPVGDNGDSVALAMAPLVASLGVADWLVHRLRSRGLLALAGATSTAAFRRLARAQFLRIFVGYALTLAALTAVVRLAMARFGADMGMTLFLDTCGYAVLGLAFFLVTTLLSLGSRGPALCLTAAALMADISLRWTPVAHDGGADLAAAHLTVFSVLLLALLPVATREYGSVIRHR